MQRLGEKLRSLRQQHSLTTRELAAALETDHAHITRIENGQKKPSPELILKMSRFFNVSTDQLMKDELDLD